MTREARDDTMILTVGALSSAAGAWLLTSLLVWQCGQAPTLIDSAQSTLIPALPLFLTAGGLGAVTTALLSRRRPLWQQG